MGQVHCGVIGLLLIPRLVSRWPNATPQPVEGEPTESHVERTQVSLEDRSNYVAGSLDRTLAALSRLGVRAVLVMDTPEPGYDEPRAMAQAVPHHRAPDADPIDPVADSCDRERCWAAGNGIPLYGDADHLTRTGALALRHAHDPVFTERQAAPLAGSQPAGQ
jgi:hypothetical protein